MNPINVCIIEDISEIRTGLKMIINSSEEMYCSGDFSNAEDAIQYIKDNPPDVVLTGCRQLLKL